MKNLVSISLLSFFVSSTSLLVSCGGEDVVETKSKVIVFSDRSMSFRLEDSTKLAQLLASNLEKWFRNQKSNIQVLTGEISIGRCSFDPHPFGRDFPDHKDNASGRREVAKWKNHKNEWIKSISQTLARSVATLGSKTSTDILSVFKDLDNEIGKLDQDEKLYVVFLSDMIHDSGGFKLDQLPENNVSDTMKKKLKELALKNTIPEKIANLEVWIYHPQPTGHGYNSVLKFWEEFFTELGVDSRNYNPTRISHTL